MPNIELTSQKLLIVTVLITIFLLIIAIPVAASTSTSSTDTYHPDVNNRGAPLNPYHFTDQVSTILQTPSPVFISPFSSTPIITPTLAITNTIVVTPTTFSTSQVITVPITASNSLLPFISVVHDIPIITPSPVETVLFCDTLSQPISIPDNDPNGVNDYITITDDRLLINLSLYLDITHGAVGNLVVKLTNQYTGAKITALNKPGNPTGECSNNDIVAILDDRAAQPVNAQCFSYPKAISGIFRATDSLSKFTHKLGSGTWQLNVSDQNSSNIGTLNHWCLKAELSNHLPPPPPPPPTSIPSSAYVDGMSGQNQQLELDCESRAAVDWARHFGKTISELGFLYDLPFTDNPETGFVGYPDGDWGNIPPDDYGVHAIPVANLLNDYGLIATPYKYLSWDDVRAEIASGNPVMVWIIGGSSYKLVNGIPVFYTAASDGKTTVVARHEHVVNVVGYTPTTVTILNGSQFVNIPLDQFLDSWSVLQFQAILARP